MEDTKAEIPKSHGLGIRHLQMVMMFLCATVMYVMRSSMGVAILAMTDKARINASDAEIYDWSSETSGMILSSFFWGYCLMQIPAGIICKIYGGKIILLIALLSNGCLCLATPLLAKWGSWVAVCIVRACMGLTQSCFMPGTHTLLGQWAPVQERTRFSNVAYAGIQIGTIVTMPICGALSTTFMGWRLIYYTMGALSLTTAALWWFFTASSPAEHKYISQHEVDYIEHSLETKTEGKLDIPWKELLTSLPLFAILCSHIGLCWTFTICLVETPMYLKSALGLDITSSSVLSTLPYIAQWITATVCSYISDYLYNNKIVTLTQSRKLFNLLGSVLGFCGLITLSFMSNANVALVIFVMTISNGFTTTLNCGFLLNHLDLSPRYAGIMFGMTSTIAHFIGLVAPLSTGYILGDDPTDIFRWRIVYSISGTVLLATGIVYHCFATSERQPWDDPDYRTTKYKSGILKKTSIKLESSTQEKSYAFEEQNKVQ